MSELLANMPDPTQDEVRGEGGDRDKRADRNAAKEDLADLAVNTSETELLSDIFGLDLRREGGQYKITPHNPNASLTEMLNCPVPPASPPTPSRELRQRHQVRAPHQTGSTGEPCSNTITLRDGTRQFSSVRDGSARENTVQYGTVQDSIVEYGTVHLNAGQYYIKSKSWSLLSVSSVSAQEHFVRGRGARP